MQPQPDSFPARPSQPAAVRRPWWRQPRWWLVAALTAAVAVSLGAEHRAHLLTALPYLILLACPLLHVFMHRGHGSHSSGGNRHD